MLVLGGMEHLGLIATGHVRENVIQRAAVAVALYMDSFVERQAQELATRPTLSTENQKALEKLLSPASMHRPIVAFRIWRGDTVAFSNERVLIGQTFARRGVPVKFETCGLPQQLPFPVKAYLYRFALESLDSTPTASGAQAQSCEKMVLEIVGSQGTLNAGPQPLAASSPKLRSLRVRIEALGGKFRFAPTPAGGLSLVAELSFSDMELAGG